MERYFSHFCPKNRSGPKYLLINKLNEIKQYYIFLKKMGLSILTLFMQAKKRTLVWVSVNDSSC